MRISQLKSLIPEVDRKEFTDFASLRLKGAAKIAADAEEKGGVALLTWHHFRVKLPYYKRAASEKPADGLAEYRRLVERLADAGDPASMSAVEFQELVGRIEVLGELIIESAS